MLLFLLLLAPLPLIRADTPAIRSTRAQSTESERLTGIINTARQRARLPPVAHSPALDNLACEKSHLMQATGNFEHYHPSLPSVKSLMDQSGRYWTVAGENLALNYLAPEEATQGWMQSRTHRENILEPKFNVHGSCRVGKYYTQLFSCFE